ncbi:hypothetical protein GW17_00031336 [Ensete ventricosum]|nr:hypothetical protein GW17_00031336 [Ensete ventricosum]RZR87276.1 hypothetical protein BHM03_00014644 [Ensete ventricosum]
MATVADLPGIKKLLEPMVESDYLEKKASSHGLERLFLLTTRSADWYAIPRLFGRRGFSECSIESIPAQRRKRINLSRGSKYYIKNLYPVLGGVSGNKPAHRII